MLVGDLRCDGFGRACLNVEGDDVVAAEESRCGLGIVRDDLPAVVGAVVDKSCADGAAAAMMN